jgi:hypothetical protein
MSFRRFVQLTPENAKNAKSANRAKKAKIENNAKALRPNLLYKIRSD